MIFKSRLAISKNKCIIIGIRPIHLRGPTGPTGPTGTGTLGFAPFDVFVQAGAVGGDGAQANPFGTIQEGVTAVLPTGTVHILGGTYPIIAQITINNKCYVWISSSRA